MAFGLEDMGRYFHLHTHSEYSYLDAMTPVAVLVERAAKMGQPALGLTDHGVMSGALRLYKECRKHDILPFPGEEFYLVSDVTDKDAERYHIGLLAVDKRGYEVLCRLSTRSHQRDRFHRKPRIDMTDLTELAEYGDHIIVTTGCYFGFIIQTMIHKSEKAAKRLLQQWAGMFPNLLVEVQHHNTVHDDGSTDEEQAKMLLRMAQACSLPVVVTQDCHYLKPAEKACHEMMKKLAYHGSDPGDFIFPGDSYHLASQTWMKAHFLGNPTMKQIWDASLGTMTWLLTLNKLSLPALDTYKFRVPTTSERPIGKLMRECRKGQQRRNIDISVGVYGERYDYEIDVIAKMGMADYFLLVADYVKWCLSQKILVEARGSANGSLVCYLLGITEVDPLVWNTSFDRFLSLDRQKPPDIDLDLDRERRDEVIAYLSSKYPMHPLGRYINMQENEEGRGSIMVKYLAYLRRTDPQGFQQKYGAMNSLWEVERQEPETAAVLHRLSDMQVRMSYGTHPAGFVLSAADLRVEDYMPLMLVPSNGNMVTQMTMDDAEEAGFCKVDLLGQATIQVMRRCMELIGKDPIAPKDWIPLDDPDTCKHLSEGVPSNGIFQFEGWTTAKGAKEMKIRSTKDAVLCMALYRTAVMKGGHKDQYLWNRKHRGQITYLHPVFEKVLKETYGVTVFQEQVIQILRELGMSYRDLNDMMKAVKQSNVHVAAAEKTFVRLFPIFKGLCKQAKLKEVDEAWAVITGFSDYGFNRAHATAYGLRAYRMAYLKVHHTLEYMTALLEVHAGAPKERRYVQEARRMGIRILPVDVTSSGTVWAIDPYGKGVRRGLTSIKGVGHKAAQAIVDERDSGPFKDMDDFVARTQGRDVTGGKQWAKHGSLNGVMQKLREVGALDSLGGH